MFRRFRNYPQIGGKKALPYDAEVDYIESTGLEYISLGTLIRQSTRLSVGFIPLGLTSSSYYNSGYFGVSNYGSRAYVSCFASDDKTMKAATLGRTIVTHDYQDGIIGRYIEVVYDYNLKTVTIDGVEQTADYYGSRLQGNESNSDFCICTVGSVAKNKSSMRIVCFKSWIGEDLQLNLIPVRVGSEGCLYDRVSGQLFRNAGTGAFIIGPDRT